MATAVSIGERLDQILGLKEIDQLVAAYFEGGNSPFAGATFDTLGSNPPNSFTADDLVAVTLLDVSLAPPAVRLLLEGGFVDEALAAVPSGTNIWKAKKKDVDACFALVERLKELPGVGPTKATKLSARKRPRICPIYDSVVGRVMGARTGPWRVPLAEALAVKRRQERILEISPTVNGFTPSALRVVDVAIWMVGSNATTAQDARETVGLQRKPLW